MLELCSKHRIGLFERISNVYVSNVLHKRYRFFFNLAICYSCEGYFIGDFFNGEVDLGDFEGVLGTGDIDFIGWVECKGDIDLFFVTLGVVTRIYFSRFIY